MYGPSYPTCSRTFATLRILAADFTPQQITTAMRLQPSGSHGRGDRRTLRSGGKTESRYGWFLSSEGRVDSLDNRDHLDWLLEQVTSRRTELDALRQKGAAADIFCYWESSNGQGGPALSPPQMRTLADLGLELSYDIYGVKKG